MALEYAKTAAKIADSSADAGARAQVAFNEVRIAVGEALQPVGAQMQEAFAEFITDIAPALISAAMSRYWIEFNFGRSSVFGEEFRANRFGCISAG